MTDRYSAAPPKCNTTFRVSPVEAKTQVQSKQMWYHTNKKYRLNKKSYLKIIADENISKRFLVLCLPKETAVLYDKPEKRSPQFHFPNKTKFIFTVSACKSFPLNAWSIFIPIFWRTPADSMQFQYLVKIAEETSQTRIYHAASIEQRIPHQWLEWHTGKQVPFLLIIVSLLSKLV